MYHQSNLTDGFLDFFHIHAYYLCQGSAIGISLVHIADINARTPSYLFGKEPEFLPHQIGMVVTLIIERTDELDKLQRPVLRLFHYRDNPLVPAGCEYHEEHYAQHHEIDRPPQRRALQQLAERRLFCFELHLRFQICFRAVNRQIGHLRHDSEDILRRNIIQHTHIGKEQRSGHKDDLALTARQGNC